MKIETVLIPVCMTGALNKGTLVLPTEIGVFTHLGNKGEPIGIAEIQQDKEGVIVAKVEVFNAAHREVIINQLKNIEVRLSAEILEMDGKKVKSCKPKTCAIYPKYNTDYKPL